MGLVDSWLEGIGLAYAVPVFSAQGINSPDLLSELDVVDFPELGITDQNDRKKVKRANTDCCNPIKSYTIVTLVLDRTYCYRNTMSTTTTVVVVLSYYNTINIIF